MTLSTAGDIVSKALQMTGAYGAQQPIFDADMQLGLDLLNGMMDVWSNFSLACFQVLEQSGVLVPGQGSYTIGPGGNFNVTRPLSILQDPGTAYTIDANGNKYPLRVVERDQWNLISNVSGIITGNFPNVLFYDTSFPLGTINITPVPNIAYTMFWDSNLQLADYSSSSQLLSLPPGYAMAMMTNLAVLAKPFFLDGQMDPVIPTSAAEFLGAIKRTNSRTPMALYDQEIVSRAGIQYNPFTDSPGSVVG